MKTKAFIKILGCGTSTGVPIPACNCNVCLSNNAKNKRLRTSALIHIPNKLSILIDAGPDLRQQSLLYGIKKLDAVLFTHAHADHILGLDDLRGFYFINKSPIPCFATKETFKDIEKIFSYIINPSSEYEGGLIAKLALHEINSLENFSIDGLIITPFNLKHGSMNVSGFKFGNLAYATDCNFIPDDSCIILENIDHLILDGLRYEAHKTHFTINEAIQISDQLKVKNTYFTHLTHSIDYEIESKKLPANKQFCFDGMEIEFEADITN